MNGGWGWSPGRQDGIWRHGARWLRPFAAAAPWLCVLVLLAMMHFVSGTLSSAKGFLFDLPSAEPSAGDVAEMVAIAIPHSRETHVYFDDSRYTLEDASSARAFREHLSQRASQSDRKTLLVLADRRVPGGALMELAAAARSGGVERILFAAKSAEEKE